MAHRCHRACQLPQSPQLTMRGCVPLIVNNVSPFGVIGRIWLGQEVAKREDYCLNGTWFVALSQKRAILFAFNISKKSNNALREPLSTRQLIIVNVGHV